MNTRIAQIIYLALLFVVAACGFKGRSISFNLDDGSCSYAFQVNSTVPGSSFEVGQPVTIRISAQYCPNYYFQIRGAGPGERFTNYHEIVKTYSSPQAVTETFIVEAYDPSSPGKLVGMAATSVSFSIVGNDHQQGEDLKCEIVRSGKPVLGLDQPLEIIMSSNNTAASAMINGANAVLGMSTPLASVSPGSGLYVADGKVTLGNKVATCSLTVQVPTCSHMVLSADVGHGSTPSVEIRTKTNLVGAVSWLEINHRAEAVPAYPDTTVIAKTEFPWEADGTYLSKATVYSASGDQTSCQATFNLDWLIATQLPVQTYLYTAGVDPGNSLIHVHSGLGIADIFNHWSYRRTQFSEGVIIPQTVTGRTQSCDYQEVVVGRRPNSDGDEEGVERIFCAKLRPELEIKKRTTVEIVWFPANFSDCPPGKILTGSKFLPWGAFPFHKVRLECGEISYR